MFLFGVTGGIGSGKTAVCDTLKNMGVPIIEADPLAKELSDSLPEIRRALMSEFGDDVYDQDGKLNRARLSQIIFSDAKARARVNQIIHPHVLDRIQKQARQIHEEEGASLIGVEAALIYESQMHSLLDAVIVVDAPLESRIAWIQERNRWSPQEILRRIESQMPVAEKIAHADYVLRNDGDLKALGKKVKDLFAWLQRKADSQTN